MLGSFEIIDFFIFELNFLRNMRIFKKNAAIKMGKAIFQNLISSALFGYNAPSASRNDVAFIFLERVL